MAFCLHSGAFSSRGLIWLRRKDSFSAAGLGRGPCARLSLPTSLLFQVAEVYRQLHAAMSQEPVKENIPYSWASVAYVKAHHYGALAHYFAATLLIDHQRKAWAQGCGLAPFGACWAERELPSCLGFRPATRHRGGKDTLT